jgi:hypothetical protein
MDRNDRRFAREAKSDIRELIAHCEALPASDSQGPPEIESIPADEFEREAEIIIRSSVGGSASLAFFLPYLWKHRH